MMVRPKELALVQGWDETRRTLRKWNARPDRVVAEWTAGALAVAALLLAATWLVATLSAPDPTAPGWPGLSRPAELADFVYLLERNGLVLALHALACVAGFMAGSSLPTLAAQLQISPALLLVSLLPHALPELTALFLPLAAWTLASRRNAWRELLAATFVTVAIATPVLVASAAIETWVTPHVMRAVSG